MVVIASDVNVVSDICYINFDSPYRARVPTQFIIDSVCYSKNMMDFHETHVFRSVIRLLL